MHKVKMVKDLSSWEVGYTTAWSALKAEGGGILFSRFDEVYMMKSGTVEIKVRRVGNNIYVSFSDYRKLMKNAPVNDPVPTRYGPRIRPSLFV